MDLADNYEEKIALASQNSFNGLEKLMGGLLMACTDSS